MEVKAFVKTILKDVTEAVEESDKENEKFHFYFHENAHDYIDFDLAIVLKEGIKGNLQAQIFALGGGKIEGDLSKEIVNRIKFRVLPFKKHNPKQ